MQRRSFLLALAAPALLATLGAGTVAAQADKPIRIGMTVSSAGTFALQAQSGQRGVEVWIDDVNSRGGIEFPLQLLAGSLLVVASGPGAIAIDPVLGIDLGPWWRAGSLAVAVVGALVAMAIARPRPQAQPPTPSASS